MVEGPRTILMTKRSESKMVNRGKTLRLPGGWFCLRPLPGAWAPEQGARWTEVGKTPLQTLLPKVVLTCSRRSEGSEV